LPRLLFDPSLQLEYSKSTFHPHQLVLSDSVKHLENLAKETKEENLITKCTVPLVVVVEVVSTVVVLAMSLPPALNPVPLRATHVV